VTYPTANQTEVTVTQDFTWTPVLGVESYTLTIGTAPGGWNALYVGGLTQPAYRVTKALPPGVPLYVRVGARVGGVEQWGPSTPFTAAAVTATVTYPTANQTDVTLTRDFTWTAVPSADAYMLLIGTRPGGWDALYEDGLIQPTHRVAGGLAPGQALYVRVGTRVGGIWRYSEATAFTLRDE
jgi:hypothetical protein